MVYLPDSVCVGWREQTMLPLQTVIGIIGMVVAMVVSQATVPKPTDPVSE